MSQSADQPAGSGDRVSDGAAPPDAPRPLAKSLRWWFGKLLTPLLMLAAGILVIVAMGLAQRIGWISAGGVSQTSESSATDQIHTCPMHPQIRQPGPGRCPICGMPLVVASSGGADLDELSVKIEPAQRRLASRVKSTIQNSPDAGSVRCIHRSSVISQENARSAAWIWFPLRGLAIPTCPSSSRLRCTCHERQC